MYPQIFSREYTKSRKDKRSHEVTLSLTSEKHEKESQCWNTRVSAMKKNISEERAKSKENLDDVKALVDHQRHKVHKQKIICQDAVEGSIENCC